VIFRSTVRDHNKLKCWNTILTFCRFLLNSAFESLDKDVLAVDNVNLNIETGSIFGVIGFSGAGKSTLTSKLLNILINVLLPAPENPITPKIEPVSIFKLTLVLAVDNVNLNIETGSIFGVIGFSGAGKSTLIRMLYYRHL
jgi:ABC-type methionine transport system ATPase subunit